MALHLRKQHPVSLGLQDSFFNPNMTGPSENPRTPHPGDSLALHNYLNSTTSVFDMGEHRIAETVL